MAAAYSESGPGSLFGMNNNLLSKLNSFREVIENKKSEVKRISEEMRSNIVTKENEIVVELEAIWEEVKARSERMKLDIQKRIEVFEGKVRVVEQLFKDLNPNSGPLINIQEKIESVKRDMNIDIPNVKLTWRINELKDCIHGMCRCEQQLLTYTKDTRFQLKWSQCEQGEGDKQLMGPWGVAMNPMNDDIFVADRENNRIQVFSKDGGWIRSLKDNEMIRVENIIFHNTSIYLQCCEAILKFNRSTEKKEKSKSYDFYLGGICKDDTHIYVGKFSGMSLIVLNLDLVEERRIILQTQFCKQNKTEIRDISLAPDEFYILLSDTENPIQAFTKNGILTKRVVTNNIINSAYCFFLDNQLNMLVADNGDSQVKVFSSDGALLAQFGKVESRKGHFTKLIGISADKLGSIVTVDWKNSHRLQLFSCL